MRITPGLVRPAAVAALAAAALAVPAATASSKGTIIPPPPPPPPGPIGISSTQPQFDREVGVHGVQDHEERSRP